MTHQLAPGDHAPDFTAPVVGGDYPDGSVLSLADLRGRTVLLYFYPKDDTPGCTKQACGLRDGWGEISKLAAVFGVSTDSVASHKAFIEKFSLPFPLLSDDEKKIVEAYGVWVEKIKDEKPVMGTERSTFVIGPDGTLKAIFRKVKPEEHFDLVLQAVRAA